jgi:prevent-host-death family protein
MIKLDRINPITDFVRNYKSYVSRIKKTGQPEVLTVNGKPECVLIDAKSYQEMADAAEEARFIKAVNEGIESMNSGAGQPARGALGEIRSELDL